MTDPNIFVTIAQRLPELDALHADPSGLRSPSLAPAGGSPNRERLPWGIGQRIDDPDDGPTGARSSSGIRAWAGHWALTIADDRHERTHTTALAYLATVTEWAEHAWPGWDDVIEEARQVLAYLDRVTGHSPQREQTTRCPSCGSSLTRDAEDHGLTDSLSCVHCGEVYQDEEIAGAVRRLTIRNTTTDTWVTREQARELHPRITANLLRQWIHDGAVATRGRDVNLADVNRRAAAFYARRAA